MSTSLSLEEKLDVVLKSNEKITSSNQEWKSSNQELTAQNEYLRKQLGTFLKQKQKMNEESVYSDQRGQGQVFSHTLDSSNDEEPLRRPRQEPRMQANSNDFRVEILEYEGKLDPEEFLDRLHTMERVFEYKAIPEDKKVKLVAFRLRKYASLWSTNLCAKRVRECKAKIRTWENMKTKLKARFLPPMFKIAIHNFII